LRAGRARDGAQAQGQARPVARGAGGREALSRRIVVGRGLPVEPWPSPWHRADNGSRKPRIHSKAAPDVSAGTTAAGPRPRRGGGIACVLKHETRPRPGRVQGSGLVWWAVQGSNLRPSPCEGKITRP